MLTRERSTEFHFRSTVEARLESLEQTFLRYFEHWSHVGGLGFKLGLVELQSFRFWRLWFLRLRTLQPYPDLESAARSWDAFCFFGS